MNKWNLITPNESNRYCIFKEELENDPLVLFHATPKENFDSICSHGFQSAKKLNLSEIRSVSYAKRSSGCINHIGTPAPKDFVVFAVKFETLEHNKIVINTSDIHVYDENIQPRILGYCEVPKDYTY